MVVTFMYFTKWLISKDYDIYPSDQGQDQRFLKKRGENREIE